MSAGLRELQGCVAELLQEVRGLRSEFKRADDTQPLTAKELAERWSIKADTPELRLTYVTRYARKWGLRPLDGTRGWEALYNRADVLHAESYAAGKIKRRKHAA